MVQQEKNTPVEKAADKPAKAAKSSVVAWITKWFRDRKSEIRKIVWPGRSQVINNTLVVLCAILIVGVFIWILDAIFSFGVANIIQLFAA